MLAMSAALGFFCAAMSSWTDRAIMQLMRQMTKCDGGTSIAASERKHMHPGGFHAHSSAASPPGFTPSIFGP